jgi:hypothetical protein
MMDFVVVNKKYKTSVEDVCVKRGADVDSDHQMLMGKLRLHLKGIRVKTERKVKIDRKKLLDEKEIEAVQGVIQVAVGVMGDDLEAEWTKFKDTMQKSMEC